MANYKKRKKRDPIEAQRTVMEHTADQLMAFEKFRTEIAPELQAMLINGASTKQILKKYESYAAAKVLTIALTETDSGKALAAAKDILDRSHGKATETKKIEHSMASIEDKDLDALLLSELDELEDIEAEFTEIDDEKEE